MGVTGNASRLIEAGHIVKAVRNYNFFVKEKIRGLQKVLASTFDPTDYEMLMEDFVAPAREAQQHLRTFFEPRQREYEEQQRQIREIVDKMIDNMSRQARESFPVLASHGWFPDFHMYDRNENKLVANLKAGQVSLVDRALVSWYDGRLNAIKLELIKTYSARRKAIASACWAHQKKRYYLSIPVFLAQADGICSEILGASPFSRRAGRPATAPVINEAGPFWEAILLPLTTALPLTASEKERQAISHNALNRHLVVHGQATDYGTRLNSAKSLSLLNFVGLALSTWKSVRGNARANSSQKLTRPAAGPAA